MLAKCFGVQSGSTAATAAARHPTAARAIAQQYHVSVRQRHRLCCAGRNSVSSTAWDQPPMHAAVAAGIAAGLVLLSGSPAYANTVFEGPARIVDGDTLYIGKDKVRLYGVDAPEKTQMCNDSSGRPYACGQISLEALKQRVGTRPVRCEVKNLDQYGRNVAACSISPDLPFQQPEDMGTFLVSNGYAVAYRAYGKEYISIEQGAHDSRKGIWQGDFTEPALWRKQQKAASLNASLASSSMDGGQQQQAVAIPSTSSIGAGTGGKPSYAAVAAGVAAGSSTGSVQQASVSAASCSGPLIKGNINSKGQKIYHTVNSGQYMRVEIVESQGERYFCTEEEAQAAGWRAAMR